jgi:ATPase subunit of ABC transporter with duplicated ATPase domains
MLANVYVEPSARWFLWIREVGGRPRGDRPTLLRCLVPAAKATHMTRISFEDVSFGFNEPLFEQLTASFDTGWTGLVAPNGAGKTTLLRLIAGELLPQAGRLRLTPPDAIAWCRQQSSDQRAELERFAADTSRPAQRWRGRLGVQATDIERFAQLSAGERKRWQLALVLANEPSVLLLDEPSNHLDAAARSLLIEALRQFEGVGVLVSHDRALLDALTKNTARIVARTLEICPGNYSAASLEWQARQGATASAREALKRDRQRIHQRADAQRRKASGAERDRSSRRAMKDKNDHDARSILRKNKAESAGRRLARDAAALDSRLGRIDAALGSLRVDKQLGSDIFADYEPWPKPIVLRASFDSLHAGDKALLGRTSLDIARADKIALEGPNGSGKSTLLAELQRQNPHAFAQSVYLPQSLSPEFRAELVRRLNELPPVCRGRALSIVAALGSNADALLASACWSPGEARKVALALGLVSSAPALILDEPTNHFDLPSIERLERLLAGFPGCVVLVTHDAMLAERVATRRVRFESGNLVERGNEGALRRAATAPS